MSDKNPNTHDAGDKSGKRNLPSWMSSRDRNKPTTDAGDDNEGDKGTAHAKPSNSATHSKQTPQKQQSASGGKAGTSVDTLSFSNLLEGVVFVLSGFVNPERSKLRSQAQEMGAEYQLDWNSNCTLLICAFPNTPKFRQVKADCGTIVSKEWISECCSQKKLVAIEAYLMHAGKPWRKSSISHEGCDVSETTPPEKPLKQAGRSLPSKPSVSASSKVGVPSHIKECLSPTEVKKWATNDLNETVLWLQSQEESPEPTEVKKIAAEGILTCLQDAIESLKKNQEIRQAIEQWKFVPLVVKELAKLEDLKSSKRSLKDNDIYEQALRCKHIYEMEFNRLDDDPTVKKKRPIESTDAAYDSDETIEMTEDEIDLAYKSISSKLGK